MKISGEADSKSGQRSEKMYEIFISNDAEKYYKKQDRDTKRRINICIDAIRDELFFGPHIKGDNKMVGFMRMDNLDLHL